MSRPQTLHKLIASQLTSAASPIQAAAAACLYSLSSVIQVGVLSLNRHFIMLTKRILNYSLMLTHSCAFIFLPLFTNVRQCKVITCLGRDSCESILCQLVHVARLHLKLNSVSSFQDVVVPPELNSEFPWVCQSAQSSTVLTTLVRSK